MSEIFDSKTLKPQYLSGYNTPQYCSNAKKVGTGGVITSTTAYSTTYNINVKMYIPTLYSSYEIDVFADGVYVKSGFTSSLVVPIPSGKTVEIDAVASGRLYSAGYLACKT